MASRVQKMKVEMEARGSNTKGEVASKAEAEKPSIRPENEQFIDTTTRAKISKVFCQNLTASRVKDIFSSECEGLEETEQLIERCRGIMAANMESLHRVFKYYSKLGQQSVDSAGTMGRNEFWQFGVECNLFGKSKNQLARNVVDIIFERANVEMAEKGLKRGDRELEPEEFVECILRMAAEFRRKEKEVGKEVGNTLEFVQILIERILSNADQEVRSGGNVIPMIC